MFLARYNANRREACASALADCPVAEALRELLEHFERPMKETATELLSLLAGFAPQQVRRSAQWPKNGQVFLVVLRRIAPQLRITGITVEFDRGPTERIVKVSSVRNEGI